MLSAVPAPPGRIEPPPGITGGAGKGDNLTVKIGWCGSAEPSVGRLWIGVHRYLFKIKQSTKGTGLNVIAATSRPGVYSPGKPQRLLPRTPAASDRFSKARLSLGLPAWLSRLIGARQSLQEEQIQTSCWQRSHSSYGPHHVVVFVSQEVAVPHEFPTEVGHGVNHGNGIALGVFAGELHG